MIFLIQFFLKNGIHSRRTLWLSIMALIPLIVAVLLWMFQSALAREGITLMALFPQLNVFLFLHFLLPLLSVFIGAAVLADEVEERTLPYLIVRPIPRRNIVLAKMSAGFLTAGVILMISLLGTYTMMMLEDGGSQWANNFGQLMQSGGVLLLGLAVYIPLFTLFGGVLKRPVIAGLLFCFGWESTVAFFPGNAKLFTVIHYLHLLAPNLQKVQETGVRNIFNVIIPTKPLPQETAVLILVLLSAGFVFLSSSLLYIREYRLEQE